MDTLRSLSQTAQIAWVDLVRMLLDDTVAGLRGKPVAKRAQNRTYWYDRFRNGTTIVERYLGEDTPELRARLDRAAALKARSEAAGAERARLVRILKAEGLLPVDVGSGQLLTAMARAGVFRLGGTLVGTQAFRLYEGVLGVRIGSDTAAMTDDIDIASFERLSLALGDRVDPDLATVLKPFRFDPVPDLAPDAVWRWRQTNRQTLVEFLTPSCAEDEGIRDLAALGVKAQSLHFLNYLIAAPVPAAILYRRGALVQVPRPERFAIHKLIVADRRCDGPEALKARKDRAQAAFLVRVLSEADPDALAEALADARARGPAWRERIGRSLARLPETRAELEGLPG